MTSDTSQSHLASSAFALDPAHLLSFGFHLAITSAIQNGMTGSIEEETTTGVLMGAMAANAPWVYAIWGDDEIASPYAWAHYSKRGSDQTSETWSGADFALVLRVSATEYRAAIFQAKRVQSSDSTSFKSVQISPEIGSRRPEPQLLRLIRHGQSFEYKPLDWLHFLLYDKHRIVALALTDKASGMRKHCEDVAQIDALVKKLDKARHAVRDKYFTQEQIRRQWRGFPKTFEPLGELSPWFNLLRSGIETPAGSNAPGWMTLTGADAAEHFVRETCPYADVFEGAPAYEYSPLLKHDASVSVSQASLQAIKTALAASPGKISTLASKRTL